MEKEGKGLHPECAFCQPKAGNKLCMENGGVGAKGCPTLTQTSVLDASNKLYEDPKVLNFAQQLIITTETDKAKIQELADLKLEV